ncbi:MAG: HupE/UreJ family protein [Methyloprofundus sp.]|nr:HupE/UreJ family protein [Methyloprofundus sp.]
MRRFKLLFIFICLFCSVSINTSYADEYRPAYLEIQQRSRSDYDVLWKVPARDADKRLSLYVEFADDVETIKPIRANFVSRAFIERSSIRHQDGLTGSKINIKGLQRVATDVLVRIQHLDGSSETTRLNAGNTSFIVAGVAQFWEVVETYLLFGVEHILGGYDHLLFIACLIFIAGAWQRMLLTITGFTLAHSITLTLAALDLVRLPIPPIEAVIALSIVFLAREIALDRRDTLTWRYPIIVSSSFGLLHGFGFASALSEIGLPQTEIPAALLAFNVGVEVGQLIFVTLILLAFGALKFMSHTFNAQLAQNLKPLEKPVAYMIGGVTVFWTLQRVVGFWA